MRGLAAAYHGPWDEIRDDAGRPEPGQLHLVRDPRARRRRGTAAGSCSIGDAAHSCPPTLAQGGAQALEDAAVLAELLLAGDARWTSELWDAFIARRFDRAKAVVEASNQLGQWLLDHEQGDVPAPHAPHRRPRLPARLIPLDRTARTAMTDRLITHLRHVDLAVPDLARQLDFYTGTWGLTAEHGDTGITFLAAEGSPEQYVVRLRQAADKRIDLIAFGAADRRRRRHPRRASSPRPACSWSASPARCRPRAAATASGSSTTRAAPSRSAPTSPSAQHRKIEEGESIPVRLSHVVINSADPEGTRAFYETPPGFRAVRHPDAPADGRDDVVHADQRLAPQPGHRPRPAPVAAPRLLRAARHRRVHARHRPAAARRGGEDLGPRPAHGRQQHLQLLPRPARQHRRVHHRAGAGRRGHLAPAPATTSPSPRSPTSGARRTR